MKAVYTIINRTRGWVLILSQTDFLEEAYLQFRASRLTRRPVRALPWDIFRRHLGSHQVLLAWHLVGLDENATVAEIGRQFSVWFETPIEHKGMFFWLERSGGGGNPSNLVTGPEYKPLSEPAFGKTPRQPTWLEHQDAAL
ncbi:MAG: hypothetical protein KAY24_00350 [Candidatus Eisenbacteria sp.]|nr:hypothetical protein [Candidatus Eisenbacteria bacterium]